MTEAGLSIAWLVISQYQAFVSEGPKAATRTANGPCPGSGQLIRGAG